MKKTISRLLIFLTATCSSAVAQTNNAILTVQLGQPISANYLTAGANLTNANFYGSENFVGPLIGLSQLTNSDGSPLISASQSSAVIAAALLANTNSPTFAQTTNIAQVQALLQGMLGTNFTLATSNSLYNAFIVALQGTNTALTTALGASNALQAANITLASNTLSWSKQPASGYLTNLALTGAYTNSLIGSSNIIFTTNLASGVVSISAALQTSLTNGLAQWGGLQPSAYLQTNLLPALTNGFISSANIAGLVSTSTAAATYYPTSNPSGFVTASITNNLALTNYYLNSNPSNFLQTSALAPYPNTNQVYSAIQSSNATLATFSSIAATNAANLALTTNLINSASNGLSAYSATSYDTNGAAAFYSKASTNGLLAIYGTTNQNNIWYDTNGAALVQYTNAVNISTNFATTNAAAQIGTAISNFSSTNAAPFVSTNAGHVNSLTINTSLQFGANTNFMLSTNWIEVKGAGVGLANGIYMQTISGIWTNVSSVGYSIVYSGGVYNLLNTNGQTAYLTNTVNGFWLTGPFGFNPQPYVAYAPTMDPILLGYIYATNLMSQVQLLINNSATNGGAGGGVNTNLSNLSQTGTNVILSLAGSGSYIASLNGFGTNTTFVGNTFLLNSNMLIQGFNTSVLIPQMTGPSTPSGLIVTSTVSSATYSNIYAFQTNEPSGQYWFPTVSPVNIEYDFGKPVSVATLSGQWQSSGSGTEPYPMTVSNSVDGVNWNYVITMINPTADVVQTVATNLSGNISARYWIWNFPQPGGAPDSVISQLQLYTIPENVISNAYTLELRSTNGVGINTNSANGNALEVLGSIDATGGYTVNGQPAFGQNSIIYSPLFTNIVVFGTNNVSGTFFNSGGTHYSAFQVSGAPAYNTLVNGTYVSATNNGSIYTNTSGYAIYFGYGSIFYIGTNTVWAYTNLYNSTNVYSRSAAYGAIGSYPYTFITNHTVTINANNFITVSYANPVITNATVSINTNLPNYSSALTVFGTMNAFAYDVYSNAWNLNLATQGMPNFCTRFNVSSNGVPVIIYNSNGVAFVYAYPTNSAGLIP